MDPLTAKLQRLLDYAEARLAADGRPVRTSALSAGSVIGWDDCCDDLQGEGQLRMRVVSIVQNPTGTTSTGYQQPYSGPCHGPTQVNIELSILRCAATVNDRGEFPTPAQLAAEADLIHSDRRALNKALLCDFPADDTPDEDTPITDIQWQPLGPEGGCVGGRLDATLQIDDCYC